MKLLIASKISSKYVEQLETIGTRVGKEVKVVWAEEKEQIRREIVDAEVFVTWWSNFDPAYIAGGKQLRWIQTLTAGVDGFLIPEIVDKGMLLTSCKGIHGIPMSEHMFGMLLGYIRGLDQLRAGQKEKSWARPRVEELHDKTLVIIGLGSIGREVAKRAKAFGMKVIGIKRTPVNEENVDKVYGPDQLSDVLEMGDVVLSILPYTRDTFHLLGDAQFARMKREAIFMNFGRGDVVDEAALVKALQKQQIRAALLDVFENEPLSPESPLWEMENVFISPHMSALSNRYMERAMVIVMTNLQAYLEGKPLTNAVDFAKGY